MPPPLPPPPPADEAMPDGDAADEDAGAAAPSRAGVALDAELTPEELQMMMAMGIPFVSL